MLNPLGTPLIERDRNCSGDQTATDRTNSEIRFMLFGLMLIVVEMKIIAAKIEDTADKCREKMSRSTEDPSCVVPLAGEGRIPPVPAQLSTILVVSSSGRDGSSSQHLVLRH